MLLGAGGRRRVSPEDPFDLIARQLRDLGRELHRHQLFVNREDRSPVAMRVLKSMLIGVVVFPGPPERSVTAHSDYLLATLHRKI